MLLRRTEGRHRLLWVSHIVVILLAPWGVVDRDTEEQDALGASLRAKPRDN